MVWHFFCSFVIRERRMHEMSLKFQDILIVLKLSVIGNRHWSYSFLSGQLVISISEAHAGVRRCVASHLIDPITVTKSNRF